MTRAPTAVLAALLLILPPSAARAENPAIAINGAQPMTLAELASVIEEATARPVQITLSPVNAYLRTDTARRVAVSWTGPAAPLLDALTTRFGLHWRSDPDAIRIYDDPAQLPAAPPPSSASSTEVRPAVPLKPAAPPTASPEPPKEDQPALPAASAAWSQGDYPAAIAIWLRLAEGDNADALYNLGQAARLGRGMPADPDTARAYYRRAAALGHARAILRLTPAAPPAPGDAALVRGSGLMQPMSANDARAAVPQLSGLWTLHLGRYPSPAAAFKAFRGVARAESIIGFPLHLYPVDAQFEMTVDQLTPAFAVQACQRLRQRGTDCRAVSGSL